MLPEKGEEVSLDPRPSSSSTLHPLQRGAEFSPSTNTWQYLNFTRKDAPFFLGDKWSEQIGRQRAPASFAAARRGSDGKPREHETPLILPRLLERFASVSTPYKRSNYKRVIPERWGLNEPRRVPDEIFSKKSRPSCRPRVMRRNGSVPVTLARRINGEQPLEEGIRDGFNPDFNGRARLKQPLLSLAGSGLATLASSNCSADSGAFEDEKQADWPLAVRVGRVGQMDVAWRRRGMSHCKLAP